MNEINSSWRCGKVGDICEPRKGKIDPRKEPSQKYIALEHIHQQTGRLLRVGDSKETTSIKAIFKAEDVLFGKLRPYLRKYWFAEFDGVCATEILPIVAKNGTDRKFLYYIFQQDKFIDYLDQKSFGTKMPRTSWKDISDYDVLIPSLSEQQKIADILTSVDNAISKTEAIIELTEKVKKGLMQQLLTKGIGHTIFKQTEIGVIPEGWSVVRLEESCDILDNQRVPLSRKIREDMQGSIPYYGATGVVDFIDRHIFDEEIVLIGEDGDHFKKYKDWSMTNLVKGKSWVNNHAHVLRAKGMVTNTWVYRALEHRDLFPYLSIQGATRLKLTQQNLRQILIPVPPIDEQNKITELIESIVRRKDLEKQKLDVLRSIKRGLMQVLLTGKVRVKVNDQEAVIT